MSIWLINEFYYLQLVALIFTDIMSTFVVITVRVKNACFSRLYQNDY